MSFFWFINLFNTANGYGNLVIDIIKINIACFKNNENNEQ